MPHVYRFQLLASLSVVAATVIPAHADEEAVAKGRDLAERLCATCHLNPGQMEKSGEDGIPGFRAIARRPDQTIDGIMAWLRSVPPMMPDHRLSQDEMEAIAQFILTLDSPG